jgi:antitoxin (DNA-binding transcriptional repressor) of toxin-antitoxin stability system
MLIDVRELAVRWEEALASAAAGEEVILTDGPAQRAQLIPLRPQGRIAGLHKGAMEAAADFNVPLKDEFWSGQS